LLLNSTQHFIAMNNILAPWRKINNKYSTDMIIRSLIKTQTNAYIHEPTHVNIHVCMHVYVYTHLIKLLPWSCFSPIFKYFYFCALYGYPNIIKNSAHSLPNFIFTTIEFVFRYRFRFSIYYSPFFYAFVR